MARLATNFAAEQHRSLIDPTLRPLPDRSGGTAAQYRKTDSKKTITEPANINTVAKARSGRAGVIANQVTANGVPPQGSGRGESRNW